jgi:hypothetical protein
MALHSVTSSQDVQQLAEGLVSATRREPWVVVSVPFDIPTPLFRTRRILEEAGDVSDVWVLKTGELSRDLAARLPERTEAYGGAARVYPPGNAWCQDPSLTKIRFIHNDSQTDKVTENLIADIHSMAYFAGLFRKTVSNRPRVVGRVKSFTAHGTRAFIKLNDREIVTVSQELTFPEVPLEWVINHDQMVTGYKDATLGRFQLDVIPVSASQILRWYPNDAVTWALVQQVDRKRATLALHPALPIVMEKAELSSNPRDRVDLFLIVGDIVPVRVVKGPQGDVRLRMNDIDDDEEVLPSQPLVVDGLPWLTEERALWSPHEELVVTPIEDFLTSIGLGLPDHISEIASPAKSSTVVIDETTTKSSPPLPATPRPGPGPSVAVVTGPIPVIETSPVIASFTITDSTPKMKKGAALTQANLRNAALKAQVASLLGQVKENNLARALDKRENLRLVVSELANERDNAQRQAQLSRDQLRETKATLRRTQAGAISGGLYGANRTRFAQSPQGAEDWVRHEISLAWIDRLGPEDRLRYSLPTTFSLGPKFAATLEALENGQKNKAFKAVVDVLTGYASEIEARHVHALREGDEATAKDVSRADGSLCLRAYIEQKTAAARRLHYWQKRDGSIELSRIVTHDDMLP